MFWEELNELDIKLIIKTEGEYEYGSGVEVFLFQLGGVVIEHFLLDGFDAHLEVVFVGVFVHEFLGEVEDGLADCGVEDEELFALGELFEQVCEGLLVVEGLKVGFVLP